MKKQATAATILKEILPDIILVLIIVVLSVSLLAQEQPAQAANKTVPGAVSEKLADLEKELTLSETQAAAVAGILKQSHEQALRDREMFKKSAHALIQAALELRRITNSRISEQLDEQQKEIFNRMCQMTPFDRELFDLTEGLLLDEEQAFTVEGILIKHYNKMKAMRPEGADEPPDRGGRMGGGGKMGDGGAMGRTPGMGGRGMGMMQDFRGEKDRAIKKILNKEQKKLFKQLQKYRKDKMREQMEERRRRI